MLIDQPWWWPVLTIEPSTGAVSARDAFIYYGLTTFAVHQVLWLVLNIPYVLMERTPERWISYKLQAKVRNSYDTLRAMFWQMLTAQTIITLPLSIVASIAVRNRVTIDWQQIPSVSLFIAQFITAVLIHDMAFYWLHRALHVSSYLYGWIHKIHHEHTAPFALAGEQAHWIESVVVFTGPLILALFGVSWLWDDMPLHVFLVWSVIGLVMLESVEGHSGYVLDWHKDRWSFIGWFNGGAWHHDKHHSGFNYNFGARWTDLLFGTTEADYYRKINRSASNGGVGKSAAARGKRSACSDLPVLVLAFGAIVLTALVIAGFRSA